MMAMTAEQLRVIIVVYASAVIPLLILFLMHRKQLLAPWVCKLYLLSFLVCAVGWELWFSYGVVAGDSVVLRRADALNRAIPYHVNWLLNSLADAGTICLGGVLLVWLLLKRNASFMNQWQWNAFFLFLLVFIGQNIFVEMFLYHDQLAADKLLSWAPLAPTGPWFNPILFEFNGRTISLQGQIPWLLMTPIFYRILIYCRNNVD